MKKNTKQTIWVAVAFILLLFFSMLNHYIPISDEGPVNNEKISTSQETNKSMPAAVVLVDSQPESKKFPESIIAIVGILLFAIIVLPFRIRKNKS